MSKKQVLYILSEEVGSQAKKITAGNIFDAICLVSAKTFVI